VRGTLRLQPGQTAVLSYWDSDPGRDGLTLVTPEAMPDGQVRLRVRMLQLTDKSAMSVRGSELLHAVSELEKMGAVDEGRLGEFLQTLLAMGGTKLVAYPTMISGSGMPIHISSVVTQPDGDWGGTKLNLRASALEEGGYDLEVNLDKRSAVAETP
jgi:hypothetical protein